MTAVSDEIQHFVLVMGTKQSAGNGNRYDTQ